MDKKISSMYFSGTDTTKKIVSKIAEDIAMKLTGITSVNTIDFTLPKVREEAVTFNEKDIVIFGVPVYAGRVPNVLLKYLNTIRGNGAIAVAVVVYGNRNYDDGLIELRDILETCGFKVIAAGAFIGEHSFSKALGKGRPDHSDMLIANTFANSIYNKLSSINGMYSIIVNGNTPYRKYYMPKNREGIPVDIRKVKPKTNSDCNKCGICVEVCPMGSIDSNDPSIINGVCIKCCACVKKCPIDAKYYDDEDYLRHKYELEIDFASRREPELFL